MKTRFSKADLFAVLTLLILFATFGPVLFGQSLEFNRELSNRATCAANVRGLVQSMCIYGADNMDMYPYIPAPSATTYDVSFKPMAGNPNADALIKNIYQGESRAPNSPSQNLWLMALKGQVSPKQFICKSDTFATTPAQVTNPQGEYLPNFQGAANLSYSNIYPWSTTRDGKIMAAPQWRNNIDASMPIISDMAPFLSMPEGPGGDPGASSPSREWIMTRSNTANHLFQGQMVGYGDAHAEFSRRADIGQGNDSIWGIWRDPDSRQNGEIPISAGKLPHVAGGSPGDFDAVMVPTRDANGILR